MVTFDDIVVKAVGKRYVPRATPFCLALRGYTSPCLAAIFLVMP